MRHLLAPVRSWLCVALVAAGAARLPAQLRHACVGRVVAADDAAVADAEVTLVWSPGTRSGEVDIVRARSDARGYFHADLVVGSPYRAWAVGPAVADGTCLVSEVAEIAAAGMVLELVAMHRSAPRTLRCDGLAPWRTTGAPVVGWRPDLETTLEIEPQATDDDRYLLPPGPWCQGAVALRTSDRQLVGLATVDATSPTPRATFPAPLDRRIEVRDVFDQPIDSAVVEQRCGGIWRRVGTTDAGGNCMARLVDNEDASAHWFCIAAGAATEFAVADVPSDERRALCLEIQRRWWPREPPPVAIRGIGPDEIAHGLLLSRVESSDRYWQSSGALCMGFPFRVEGQRIVFDRLALPVVESTILLTLVPRHEGTVRFAITAARSPGLPPDVDLTRMHTVRIRAVDTANNPLPGVRIGIYSTVPRSRWDVRPLISQWLVLDHAGRADLLLEGQDWYLYATNGREHVEQTLAAVVPDELLLKLEAMPTLRCKIMDADGKPVRGARIEIAPDDTNRTNPQGVGQAKSLSATVMGWSMAAAGRSDRDGNLALPVQDWVTSTSMVRVRAGERVSTSFPPVASDKVLEIRLDR